MNLGKPFGVLDLTTFDLACQGKRLTNNVQWPVRQHKWEVCGTLGGLAIQFDGLQFVI